MSTHAQDVARVLRSLRRLMLGVGFAAMLVIAVVVATTVTAERGGCARNVADRVENIRVWEKQAWAADRIAADSFQSRETRDVRSAEAAALWAAIARVRKRVDPANGGELVCSEAYPYALPLP